jgi:hypothetical protein
MIDTAVKLIKYLFFCVIIYGIIFVFTFVVLFLAEWFKVKQRRGKNG